MQNPKMTQMEIADKLDLTRKQVQNVIKGLQEGGIIEREGSNRNGKWIVNKYVQRDERNTKIRDTRLIPVQSYTQNNRQNINKYVNETARKTIKNLLNKVPDREFE